MMGFDKVVSFYEFAPGRHDFYRCVKCQSIFTLQYERERIAEMSKHGDRTLFIHCTSLRYQPALPTWYEWFYPRVFIFAAKVLLARVVAPWAEKNNLPRVWMLAMQLAGNKVTR